MTVRIFDENPQQSSLQTQIIGTTPCVDGVLVQLAETIFFPRGGGQPAESGTIGGMSVLDVFEEDNTIYHKMQSVPLETSVLCEINLAERIENMCHHTAQHIISAAAVKLFANSTIIARIEPEFAHIEFERDLSMQELAILKQEAIKIVEQDLKVECNYFAPDEAAKMDIRGKITPHSQIRVVDILGFDKNACGGTHCAKTGDILTIAFVATKRVRGAFRLYFAAGIRAERYNLEQEIRAIEMCDAMNTTSPIELKDSIVQLKNISEKQAEEITSLKKQLAECDAEILAACGEEIGATIYICRDFAGRQIKQIRAICENILKTQNAIILISNVVDGAMSVLFMQHKSLNAGDLGTMLKQFLADFGGKGGGNKMMAQGELPYSQCAQAALDLLRTQIKSAL